TYLATTAFVNSNLFSADGAGASLGLSSLTSFQYGTTNGRWFQTINASNGGQVNLSNVQTISTLAGEDEVVTLNSASGGTILLSALQTISDTGNGNNAIRFVATSATQNLSALTGAA